MEEELRLEGTNVDLLNFSPNMIQSNSVKFKTWVTADKAVKGAAKSLGRRGYTKGSMFHEV